MRLNNLQLYNSGEVVGFNPELVETIYPCKEGGTNIRMNSGAIYVVRGTCHEIHEALARDCYHEMETLQEQNTGLQMQLTEANKRIEAQMSLLERYENTVTVLQNQVAVSKEEIERLKDELKLPS